MIHVNEQTQLYDQLSTKISNKTFIYFSIIKIQIIFGIRNFFSNVPFSSGVSTVNLIEFKKPLHSMYTNSKNAFEILLANRLCGKTHPSYWETMRKVKLNCRNERERDLSNHRAKS